MTDRKGTRETTDTSSLEATSKAEGRQGKQADLSRRAFLGLGAAAATAAVVAGTGLAGCAQGKTEGNAASGQANGTSTTTSAGNNGTPGGAPSAFVPDFMTPPAVPSSVKETKECDVLVIGLGLSGCAAAKAASDEGAKVIGIDKAPQLTAVSMAGDFGVIGSKIQKDLGIKWADKGTVMNQLMKDMCYRPTPAFIDYWYDHSGADFDWFVEGADFEVLTSTAAEKQTDNPYYIRPKCFPPLAGYDYKTEFYPYFHGTITANPNMQWTLDAALAAAEKAGAEFIFSTWGEQLIVEGGAVTGAYVCDKDKNYTRINAKAVVLATGDFGNNPEMRHYYVPWANEFACYYTTMDANGAPADTGDGHLMGIWAGAHMELGPLAPMTHHMGGALGVDSYLQLNMEGKRFMNEDIPGQPIADQLSRQPASLDPKAAEAGIKSWQIFDAAWPEQIQHMPDGHGYVNHFVPDDQVDQFKTVLAGFGLGYTTKAMVEESVTLKADTLDELAKGIGLPVDTVKAQIARYNELCKKGIDEDFGKDARRMFPIEKAPYYACAFGSAGMLVLMGGLEVNMKLQAVNDQGEAIGGLYVCGNTMGGRYLVEYPVTVAGISLAQALTFGRLAGQNAAGKGIDISL
ncbi:MAG: FAD-binding protein [Coriobacteriaceae bacterium]|jgi:succinate dehydrogenase/fumarate reductase flavoprotein subunit|nr:FAD-binding protein [Coriobacteriaceae bacterium]